MKQTLGLADYRINRVVLLVSTSLCSTFPYHEAFYFHSSPNLGAHELNEFEFGLSFIELNVFVQEIEKSRNELRLFLN
jgi:hypothetical protein